MSTDCDGDIREAAFSFNYELWWVDGHRLTMACKRVGAKEQGEILYDWNDALRVAATDNSVRALERYLDQSHGALVIPSIYGLPEMCFEGIKRIEPLRAPNRYDFLLRVREQLTLPGTEVPYERGDYGTFFTFGIEHKPAHLRLLDSVRTAYIQLSAGKRFLPLLDF